ncbi:hypothetical protein FSY59_12945 [Comamonas sp. Z3]|uniref:hypothetical protein n=1 Tax=Comamonas sp. Z3 TaxID=2601247 RepID=UPI0011E6328A|nr:hypothetical protein [Comamonas sp. Z3]TYK69451.1 hypothetical protein FSY59_19135 [Comamonas sp. Z3]TYK70460.1 hypothetical protein FSY59_12945 [Comamonas sp. Z3]
MTSSRMNKGLWRGCARRESGPEICKKFACLMQATVVARAIDMPLTGAEAMDDAGLQKEERLTPVIRRLQC